MEIYTIAIIWFVLGFIFSLLSTFYRKEDWRDCHSLLNLIFTFSVCILIWPILAFIEIFSWLTDYRDFWFHKKD